jgi:hypothetical protein
MARLHEYQGKAILAANGFKIPRGRAASTADEAVAVAKELGADTKGGTVVIKIQAWTTGRAGHYFRRRRRHGNRGLRPATKKDLGPQHVRVDFDG